MLVEFSVTCICQHLWGKIIWCHIPRKSLNLCIFTHTTVSPLETIVESFENVFPKTEGVEEATICSVKIQSENMKMTWNISLFPFGMIAIFLNVVALQFFK